MRLTISKTQFFMWFVVTFAVVALVWWLVSPAWGLLVVPLSLAVIALRGFYSRRLNS